MPPRLLVPLLVTALLAPWEVNTVSAHGDHRLPASIRGTIIGLTPGGFRLQTATGLVPVAVASGTQVLLIVSGSLADLHPGERAGFDLAADGKTVTVVHLGAPVRAPHRSQHDDSDGLTYRAGHGSSIGRQVQGQIVTMTRHSVRIRCPHSPLADYRFSRSVRVVKQMQGSRLQLAVGEDVQVMWTHAAIAGAVVIWGA